VSVQYQAPDTSPQGRVHSTIGKEAGWAPEHGHLWKVKNPCPAGNQILAVQPIAQSVHQLSYLN